MLLCSREIHNNWNLTLVISNSPYYMKPEMAKKGGVLASSFKTTNNSHVNKLQSPFLVWGLRV